MRSTLGDLTWARTWAKAPRYAEEIGLVEEEMRHVLHFLRWRRDWWHARAELRMQVDVDLHEGQAAYVRKQAGYMHGLRERFKKDYATMMSDDNDASDGVQELRPDSSTLGAVEAATPPQTELEQELVHE
ncbi:hypothetical protein DFH08DRAFT_953211 [Mycena albidolilacea]|uniref:Uncharacterized protein n=1 Tax=Mycena albidolilacea TaxID=1033008 RepID=A0AAD7AG80_9AGAR|nr:hypothetical protein DFH08DRAFT_953211 [Mycena albidolilacea]